MGNITFCKTESHEENAPPPQHKLDKINNIKMDNISIFCKTESHKEILPLPQHELDKINKIIICLFVAETSPPQCHVSCTINFKDGSYQYFKCNSSSKHEAREYCEKRFPGIIIE